MGRGEILQEISRRIMGCKRCRLWMSRSNAVPGFGNPDAHILLVGEAPGRSEDREGKPFVGAAGQLLDRLLAYAGIRRSEVYITNVVKCRPPNNRDPLPDEVEACACYFDEQVRTINPKLLVCLGRHSTNMILLKGGNSVVGRRGVSISTVRGQALRVIYQGLDLMVFPTYHPAAGLYSLKFKNTLVEDFKRLGALVKELDLSSS
ncbi:MAG: uracil-DNA glycosylase [Candidatus Nezhaarchaeota archaeon]|nr:uracil-DNA glycosylase [Candidatus Nezhaarchaeota archaeon]